jgi:hypothetical protein
MYGMVSYGVLRFPNPARSPAVQSVREWCWPAREKCWALRGLSGYYLKDVARLLDRSEVLLARSRRLRIKLLP